MQDPEQQRADYQALCKYRRNGKTIEKHEDGKWVKSTQFSTFNGAKRGVREMMNRGEKVYVV